MSEWQPIESAPKDESEFLGYGGGNYYIASWLGGWTAWPLGCDECFSSIYSLTHWMPLPKPPSQSDS